MFNTNEPFFVSVNEAKRLLCLGHTRIYELMSSGDLEKVKAGGKTLISYVSIKNYAALLKLQTYAAEQLAETQAYARAKGYE